MLYMKIKETFNSSFSGFFLRLLFKDDYQIYLDQTFFGSLLGKICLPLVSEIALLFAVILFWYEGFLGHYFPFLNLFPVASILLILSVIFADKSKILLKKYHIWYLFFLLFSGISGLMAATRGINYSLVANGFFLFAQFGIAMIAAQGVKNKKKILAYLVFLSLPFVLTGIFQALSHIRTASTWLSPGETGIETRAFSFFGSPNVMGLAAASIFLLSIFLYLENRKKFYMLFIAALNLLAVFFSFSRTAWLGLLLALFLAVIIKRRFLIYLLLLASVLLLIPQIKNRVTRVFMPNYLHDATLDGRLWAMINGFYIAKKHIIFGAGPGTYGGQLATGQASPVYLEGIQNGYTALYYTDNQFLEILVQVGILGLLAFFGFVVAIFVNLWGNIRRQDNIYLGALSIFVCFLVGAVFSNVLEFGAVSVPVAIILGSVMNES
ncbi:hypothetical protein COX25_01880 [bacterium (Candidatus Howlettbacteria) CG23_combo_of_CG06-09_8_20_14_all_37_9]|nr:MAG: hypothetical protein COX25_01880 [bacterium (Candidatus Howlettbacteria) CG23_combo_of_CG06-09_8_20_14_all_37_9]